MDTVESFIESMASWNTLGSQELSSSCVDYSHEYLEVKFGSPLNEVLYDNHLPCQLVEMLVYIASCGATTADIFRRPGSTADMAVIIADLAAGRLVDFSKYNFHTLASVVKRFLLKIPGGMFGAEIENQLLDVLRLNSRSKKYKTINSIVTRLPLATQQLFALLLGTWFRVVNHSEYNTMSSDAVAKNVALYLFHSVAGDLDRDQRAVHLLQILIDDFSVPNMLGSRNVQYFADMSRARVYSDGKRCSVRSIYSTFCSSAEVRHCCRAIADATVASPRTSFAHALPDAIVQVFPPTPSSPAPPRSSSPRHESSLWVQQKLSPQSSKSAPEVNETLSSPSHNPLASGFMSLSLSRFDGVKRRQLMRLKRRSHWFLSSNSSTECKLQLPHFETSSSLICADNAEFHQTAMHNVSSSSFNDSILSNSSFCPPCSDTVYPSAVQEPTIPTCRA